MPCHHCINDPSFIHKLLHEVLKMQLMQNTLFESTTILCFLSWLGETTSKTTGGLLGSSLLATKDGIFQYWNRLSLCVLDIGQRDRVCDLYRLRISWKGFKMQSTTKMNGVFAKLYQEVHHRKWKFLTQVKFPQPSETTKLAKLRHSCQGTVWKEI